MTWTPPVRLPNLEAQDDFKTYFNEQVVDNIQHLNDNASAPIYGRFGIKASQVFSGASPYSGRVLFADQANPASGMELASYQSGPKAYGAIAATGGADLPAGPYSVSVVLGYQFSDTPLTGDVIRMSLSGTDSYNSNGTTQGFVNHLRYQDTALSRVGVVAFSAIIKPQAAFKLYFWLQIESSRVFATDSYGVDSSFVSIHAL